MNIDILNESKEEIEFKIESATLAELLRVYLNEDSSVSFAAWKKKVSNDFPILKIKTKGKTPKKAISDAISAIEKDLEKAVEEFSKLK